jgi:membrane dipeptidase
MHKTSASSPDLQEALETAAQLHNTHPGIDSLAPSFVTEWVMTPAMVELARSLQSQGLKRSAIQAALAEHSIERCANDPETRREYLAYWRRSGIAGCYTTLYASGPPDDAWSAMLRELGRAGRMIEALDGEVVVARRAEDFDRAWRAGKMAVMYHVQNAEPIADQLDRIDTLDGLGLCAVQLTNNLRNRVGEGCLEPNDGGLSRFGQALVQKLNARQMLVDVSHGSPRTALDAVAVSSVPVIASHTAARALSGHARGLPDEVIRAIADKGGYIGVVIMPAFILPAGGDGRAEKHGKPPGWATLDTVADHVEHLIRVAGEDHVGIGSDWGKPYYTALTWSASMVNESIAGFDWVGWRPEDRFDPNMQCLGMETWDSWPNLTATLLHRGLPERVVAKVIGGNFLRVFRDVCG